jgi:hypothetical protein
MVHEGGWQLVKRDDGSLLAVPPTMRFSSNPEPELNPYRLTAGG